MNVEIGEKFPVEIIEEGTLMDFSDQEFVFIVKDEKWMPYELQCLKEKPLEIQFVYKYDIAVFLLTLEDALDTSDFIFNVHDNIYDEDLFTPDKNGYKCSLYFLDKENVVRGKKKFRLSQESSVIIAEKLCIQRDISYQEEEFLCNLEGLQMAYEPFEMQPLALFTDRIK